VVLFRRRTCRQEVAELLQAMADKHPTGAIYVAWDNEDTHADAEIEAVLKFLVNTANHKLFKCPFYCEMASY
jgi:hypothetical protein